MHDRDDVKQKNHSTGQSIHGDEKLQKKKIQIFKLKTPNNIQIERYKKKYSWECNI